MVEHLPTKLRAVGSQQTAKNNRGGAAKDRQTEQPDGLEKEV